MPNSNLTDRLDAIEQELNQNLATLERIRGEVNIHNRIDDSNTREINKLKAHVAALQIRIRESTEAIQKHFDQPL